MQVELFLIDNVPALDLFWIAAQGRNDVCCLPLRSEWVLAFHDKSNDAFSSKCNTDEHYGFNKTCHIDKRLTIPLNLTISALDYVVWS
jgi:hypothetical protein